MANQENPTEKNAKGRKLCRAATIGAGLVTLAEAVTVGSRRGSMFAIRTIVRCHSGHLFTTVWIPGASIKALRLGPWRLQRCPVGPHWSLVTPARARELSDEQRSTARSTTDGLVP